MSGGTGRGVRAAAWAWAALAVWGWARAAGAQEAEPPPGFLKATEKPGYFAQGGEARGITVAEERGIAFDIQATRQAQDAALAEQAKGEEEALVGAREEGAWAWLDEAHDAAYRLMDNLVRTLDLSWTRKGDSYETDLSTFLFGAMVRAGGRGKEGNSDAKAKVRADAALPGLERRFHLILDNAGRDSLPGSDPMEKESDLRVGIKSVWKTWVGADFDLGGGLRLRSGKPVGFVEGSLEWEWEAMEGNVWLKPQVFWYTDERFGQETVLGWRRYFGAERRWGVELRSAEKGSEADSDFQLEETARGAWMHGEKRTRGWIVQTSVFPRLDNGGKHHTRVDDWLASLTWKDALYRRWMFYSLTGQLDFGREDDYHARGSVRLGVEILFGGEARPLM